MRSLGRRTVDPPLRKRRRGRGRHHRQRLAAGPRSDRPRSCSIPAITSCWRTLRISARFRPSMPIKRDISPSRPTTTARFRSRWSGCWRTRIRFRNSSISVPNFQNPTGRTLTRQRRGAHRAHLRTLPAPDRRGRSVRRTAIRGRRHSRALGLSQRGADDLLRARAARSWRRGCAWRGSSLRTTKFAKKSCSPSKVRICTAARSRSTSSTST